MVSRGSVVKKSKRMSSDILVDFMLTVNLQYLVNMAPNRGLLRFQLSSLCWFCGQKRDVKTYILRTRCAQGQFKVSLCDTVFVYIYPTAKYLALRMLVQAMYLGLRIRYLSCHGFVWECRQEVKKNIKRYLDFEFTVLGEHGAQQGIFEISIFRDLIRFGLKKPMESHPKCLSDDSVSFMSEFHEVWCPNGIGWVSGCGHFHIDDRKCFPKEGCSLSSVKWNSKEDLSLVPIIVVVVS